LVSLAAALVLAADPTPVRRVHPAAHAGALAGSSVANGRRYVDLPLALTFSLEACAFTAELAFVNTTRPTAYARSAA
jgi:hypothetical protein